MNGATEERGQAASKVERREHGNGDEGTADEEKNESKADADELPSPVLVECLLNVPNGVLTRSFLVLSWLAKSRQSRFALLDGQMDMLFRDLRLSPRSSVLLRNTAHEGV
jgi:hypothetical protein